MSLIGELCAEEANAKTKEWIDALEKILGKPFNEDYGPDDKLIEIEDLVKEIKAYQFSE